MNNDPTNTNNQTAVQSKPNDNLPESQNASFISSNVTQDNILFSNNKSSTNPTTNPTDTTIRQTAKCPCKKRKFHRNKIIPEPVTKPEVLPIDTPSDRNSCFTNPPLSKDSTNDNTDLVNNTKVEEKSSFQSNLKSSFKFKKKPVPVLKMELSKIDEVPEEKSCKNLDLNNTMNTSSTPNNQVKPRMTIGDNLHYSNNFNKLKKYFSHNSQIGAFRDPSKPKKPKPKQNPNISINSSSKSTNDNSNNTNPKSLRDSTSSNYSFNNSFNNSSFNNSFNTESNISGILKRSTSQIVDKAKKLVRFAMNKSRSSLSDSQGEKDKEVDNSQVKDDSKDVSKMDESVNDSNNVVELKQVESGSYFEDYEVEVEVDGDKEDDDNKENVGQKLFEQNLDELEDSKIE